MSSHPRKVVLTYSDAAGAHSFSLDGPSVSIGRHPDQDLVLAEKFVSRHHAVVRQIATGFEIEDLGSSHGTYLNGERVRCAPLKPGDTLQFGSTGSMKFRFQILDQDGPSRSAQDDLLSTLGQITADQRAPVREINQLNFLLDAARRLNAGYVTNDILHALLQIAIQLTHVERGFVFLIKPEANPDHRHSDLRLALGLNALGEILNEDSTVSRSAIGRAIENSSNFTISDTWVDALRSPTDSIVANAIRSIFCIPLRRRSIAVEPARSAVGAEAGVQQNQTNQHAGKLLGLLYLDSRVSANRLDTIDRELLDMISTEAATLLDNALLLESEQQARIAAQELAVAAQIHAGLMPATLPSTPHAALQARTIPCREIGGDFYDVVVLPDCLALVIADISGKGVPASIVAATLQGIIHAQILTGQPLDAVAALINRFLCERNVGKYATLVLMKLYPSGRLDYINCGHIPPLRVYEHGAEQLMETNLVVGLITNATFEVASTQLAPGDRILLATDGIHEAINSDQEEFGEERYLKAADLEHIDAILDLVAQFQGENLAQDDRTLVEFRYLGPAT